MPTNEVIIPVRSKPGVVRDGTVLAGDAYINARWCRFQRGLPRKIGGYRAINKYLSDVVREINAFTIGQTYVHCASANLIERFTIDGLFNTSIITDRTPTASFTADDQNLWQLDVAARLNGGVWTNLLVGQVAPNLDDITNTEGGELFSGALTDTSVLTAISLPSGANASGGIVPLHPYLFYFGHDGLIGWSVSGDPRDLSGAGSGFTSVTHQKIVRGMPLRGGGGNSPSGLFWSADELLRATFVGGAPVFSFDTISAQTSILSSRSVIEYDGVFYWAGTDRFLMFNGVVREVPNALNQNFFFDNLNYDQRQKVFVFKVPRYGEIWWCFPFGDATEPDWAVIYNVREQTWYDTPLPTDGRSSAIFPTVFRKPLMTASEAVVAEVMYRVTEAGDYRITEAGDSRVTEDSEDVTYKLWIHEQGVDAIDGQSAQPIQSYFETGDISIPVDQTSPGNDRSLQTLMLEPDFVQSGDMTVQVRGRQNARAPETDGPIMTFVDAATTPAEEVVFLKEQRRQLRLRFESNTIGGDYEMGLPLLHVRPGDGTTLS